MVFDPFEIFYLHDFVARTQLDEQERNRLRVAGIRMLESFLIRYCSNCRVSLHDAVHAAECLPIYRQLHTSDMLQPAASFGVK
jgi:hypothetical protein